MRKSNCYQAFAPAGVRLILYAALPALLLALQVFALRLAGRSLLEICAGLYGGASIFFDFWIFGGICARETNVFEYLKTSAKGRRMMRQALVWDGVCHFCNMAAVLLFGAVLEWRFGPAAGSVGVKWAAGLLALLLLDYAVWLLGVSVARYFTMMVWYYMVSTCAMGIYFGLAAWADRLIGAGHMWVLVPIAAAAAGVSVFSVKNVMRRMEGSYRDETMETGREDD